MEPQPMTSGEAITAAERLLKALPTNGEGWYVEAVRPGHEDEARVYDGQSWGVCKPTPNSPAYRRPIAEFVAAAPELVSTLRAALLQSQEALRQATQHIRDVVDHQPFPDDSGWRVYAEPLLKQILRDAALLSPPRVERRKSCRCPLNAHVPGCAFVSPPESKEPTP